MSEEAAQQVLRDAGTIIDKIQHWTSQEVAIWALATPDRSFFWFLLGHIRSRYGIDDPFGVKLDQAASHPPDVDLARRLLEDLRDGRDLSPDLDAPFRQ